MGGVDPEKKKNPDDLDFSHVGQAPIDVEQILGQFEPPPEYTEKEVDNTLVQNEHNSAKTEW